MGMVGTDGRTGRIQADRQTGRIQADRQTDGLADRQTNRQTNGWAYDRKGGRECETKFLFIQGLGKIKKFQDVISSEYNNSLLASELKI